MLKDPAPDVVVDELAGSSVNLKIRAWVDSADGRRRVFFRLNEVAKQALDAQDIEIAFPHLQLILDSVEERVLEGVTSLAEGSGHA